MSNAVVPENTDPTGKQGRTLSKQMTIIGRGECGKTCILNRLVHGTFSESLPATPIESEIMNYDVNGTLINLKIFDTSGQDDYSRFRALTLPISDYVLVCYSIIDRASFKEVEDTLVSMIEQKAPAHAKVVLCATKIDCMEEGDIDREEGLELKKRIGAVAFFECSSFTGQGIHKIFDYIKNDIYAGAVESPAQQPKGFFSNLFCC